MDIAGAEEDSRAWKKARSKLKQIVTAARESEKLGKDGKVLWLKHKYGNIEKVKTKKIKDEELLGGIKYKDKDMNEVVKEESKEELVAGDVVLDSDEKSILELPPKFALYEKLTATEMKSDAEQAACKIRYNRRQEDSEIDLDEDEVKAHKVVLSACSPHLKQVNNC